MKTDAIVRFMQLHYSDEKLAALLAHAEDGKLMYMSCCCFIGVATADHALCGEVLPWNYSGGPGSVPHYRKAKDTLEGSVDVEIEFFKLGINDAERRQNLIPLIKAEFERRESLRQANNSVKTGSREVSAQPADVGHPRVESTVTSVIRSRETEEMTDSVMEYACAVRK